jgi:colanic acid biosynthesis glycosyl transferase WcaI
MMANQLRTQQHSPSADRMRLLLFGSFYEPEQTGIAPYTTGLAAYLAGQGHHVTVMTGMPSYPQWRVYPDYRGRLHHRELLGGVDVRRVRNYVPRRQTTMHRALYEASFLLGGLTALRLPRPDAVLGVLPALSMGMITRLAAHHFGSPYGLLFQDLTGQAASQSGVVGARRAAGVICGIEGWVARKAGAIGIIADGFRPYVESLGVDPHRICRVRNWVHIAEPKLDRLATRRRLGLREDVVVCLHAGNMGFKQDLRNVVECARLAIQTDPQLLFVLMGDGNQRPLLVNLAQRHRLSNLRFLPIQPVGMFSSVLAAADMLLINQRASVTDMSLPSKLTSYCASGRPILAAVSAGSETAMEVQRIGSGVLVPPNQPVRLLEAVRNLVDNPALQMRLGMAGYSYAKRDLSPGHALAGLEAMVRVVASSSRDHERLAI